MNELVREPGEWRGGPPAGRLVMEVIGPVLAGDRPGWVTVTGWRDVPGEPRSVWSRVQVRTSALSSPAIDPRDRALVAPADSYRAGDRVWVWRHGGWQPGLVEHASAFSVLVRYQAGGIPGWVADQVTESYVMVRDEFVPHVDAEVAVVPRRPGRHVKKPADRMDHLVGRTIDLDCMDTLALEEGESVPITVAYVLPANDDPNYVELDGISYGLAGNLEWARYEVLASRLVEGVAR